MRCLEESFRVLVKREQKELQASIKQGRVSNGRSN